MQSGEYFLKEHRRELLFRYFGVEDVAKAVEFQVDVEWNLFRGNIGKAISRNIGKRCVAAPGNLNAEEKSQTIEADIEAMGGGRIEDVVSEPGGDISPKRCNKLSTHH